VRISSDTAGQVVPESVHFARCCANLTRRTLPDRRSRSRLGACSSHAASPRSPASYHWFGTDAHIFESHSNGSGRFSRTTAGWHDDPTDYERDNEKWSVPGRHGYRLVLATWTKVTRDPDALVRAITATLAA
jgi:hypothetical protein